MYIFTNVSENNKISTNVSFVTKVYPIYVDIFKIEYRKYQNETSSQHLSPLATSSENGIHIEFDVSRVESNIEDKVIAKTVRA